MTAGGFPGIGTRARAEAPAASWTLLLPDIDATASLARMLADDLRPGDLVTLSGGLGAGKTALARALVRELTQAPDLDVPSPTFTLMQSYDGLRGPIVHADFYRLAGADELYEIGWDEAADEAVALVEWPEKAEDGLNATRLAVHLDIAPEHGPDARIATLAATGSFAARLQRLKALQTLLARTGHADAARIPIHGDASVRSYERLVKPDGATAILMIAPPRPAGPPVRRGKSYAALARLAETVHPFVAMDRALRGLGLSAPEIYGEALDEGLVVLEDLGDEGMTDGNGPIPERYAEATRVLARLHGATLPAVLPVGDGREHAIPPFDLEAMLIEAELLLDWYLPHVRGVQPSGSARAEFVNLWTETLIEVLSAPATWTLRDVHSPNLIWLPGRNGLQRVGLIDFQDAVLGHPAYDVASLLQDARADVPPELELKLLSLYARERRMAALTFDAAAFARAYAIMGAQRSTRLLGLLARRDKRDGRPQDPQDLPRIASYLARNLSHPALDRLKGWYESALPHLGGAA